MSAKPMKRGTLTLRASVTVDSEHDVLKYLRALEREFADRFSIAAHGYYPGATVETFVQVDGETRV